VFFIAYKILKKKTMLLFDILYFYY